jgi:hypothetical protein
MAKIVLSDECASDVAGFIYGYSIMDKPETGIFSASRYLMMPM